jgi:Tat protein secretion system quality control protein TatD with DNase activity
MSSFASVSASAVAGFAREAIPHRGGLPLRLLGLEGSQIEGYGAAYLQSTLGTSIESSVETITDPFAMDSSKNAYNYQLCDIGANLCDEMYNGVYNDKKRHPNDLLAVLQRARATNVSKILCTAGSIEDSRRTLQLLRTPVPVQWRSQAASPSLDDLPTVPESASSQALQGREAGDGEEAGGAGRQNLALTMAEQYGLYMTVGVHPTRAALFLPGDAEPLPSSDGSIRSETTPRTGSRVLDELLSIIIDANSAGGDTPAHDRDEQEGWRCVEKNSAVPPIGTHNAPRRTVVALGECGLDYARLEFCSKEQQLAGFRLQLQLASHPLVDLPLFLHSRDTDGDFLRIMRESHHLYARRGGVVHSFDGTVDEMLAL